MSRKLEAENYSKKTVNTNTETNGHGCVPIKPAGQLANLCYVLYMGTQHVAKAKNTWENVTL